MATTHVERALAQLADMFTVRDVMIDVAELVRADTPTEAETLLETHPDYDHIPLPRRGRVGGYVARGDHGFHALSQSDLISDGTSLLRLPELLVDRSFFFVLTSNQVQGFVHFSDLNNGLVKLPLYVLFEAIERHFAPQVAAFHPSDEELEGVLSEERVKDLRDRVRKAAAQRANRSLLDYIYFEDLLRLCKHYGVIQLKGEDQQALCKFRNRVAHSNLPLIEDHKDMRQLVRARDAAQRLLA